MESGASRRHGVGVPRVLLTWSRPTHLSEAEAASWARATVERLTVVPDVSAVSLTRVAGAEAHARPGDWVCELHVCEGADALACVSHAACVEGLLDLRLLGMQPAVAILDATQVFG
jgi:hypothetical protein